jgi:hypothetical protein
MKTSVLALLVLATGTVSADTLISYKAGDDKYVVARLSSTGVKELMRAPEDASAYRMWLDAKTLVHLNVDFDKNITVTWVVDGAIDAKRTIKHKAAVWGLKPDEEFITLVAAYRGADGALWLERCVKQETADCEKSVWLRVDTATATAAKKKPAKLTVFGEAVTAPKVEAPVGYAAKLVKIKSKVSPKQKLAAVECTGPKGKSVWSQESPPIDPAEQFTPKKVRWISTTPSLLEVEGLAVNPVGQEATVRWVFRDCAAEPFNSVTWIADRTWSYDTRDDSDKFFVMVDDKPLVTITGHDLLPAPK